MPIEIRPSDVVLGAAKVFRGGAKTVGDISSLMYEAERVSEINRQLAYTEQIYQRYNKDMPDRKSTRLNSSHIPLSRMPSSA